MHPLLPQYNTTKGVDNPLSHSSGPTTPHLMCGTSCPPPVREQATKGTCFSCLPPAPTPQAPQLRLWLHPGAPTTGWKPGAQGGGRRAPEANIE